MRRAWVYRAVALGLAFVLVCPVALTAHAQEDAPSTWEEYAERVADARDSVDDAMGELMDSRAASDLATQIHRLLPAREPVEMPDGLVVVVDNSTLRAMTTELDAADSASERSDTVEDLAQHLESLESAVGEPGMDVPEDPELLTELVDAQPQSNEELQRWLAQMVRRLEEWIAALFATTGGETSATVIDWMTRGLIIILALILVYILFRVLVRLRKSAQERDLSIAESSSTPVVAAAEGLPDDVLAHADELAAHGRRREAVRALYGGAARSLVDAGYVRQTRTLTSRELLSSLGPAPDDVHEVLERLTDIFEIAWYGHRDPGDEGFALARAEHVAITTRVRSGLAGGDE